MIEILGKWINENHPSQFTVYDFSDLSKLNNSIQDLIESTIRKEIIKIALKDPCHLEMNLINYFTRIIAFSKVSGSQEVEGSENYKIIINKIIDKFQLKLNI